MNTDFPLAIQNQIGIIPFLAMNTGLPAIIQVQIGMRDLPTMKIYEEVVHRIQTAQFHVSLQILEGQEWQEIMDRQLNIM
jgi:hypothetical protein